MEYSSLNKALLDEYFEEQNKGWEKVIKMMNTSIGAPINEVKEFI